MRPNPSFVRTLLLASSIACGAHSTSTAPPESSASTEASAPALTPDGSSQGVASGISLAEVRRDLEGRDTDKDGVTDWDDNCRHTPNPDQMDGDKDTVGDACDRCPDLGQPTWNHGCPEGRDPCLEPCPETQTCDLDAGSCVDLPPPPAPQPVLPEDPVERCKLHCTQWTTCDELEPYSGELFIQDFVAACASKCESDVVLRDDLNGLAGFCGTLSTVVPALDVDQAVLCSRDYCPAAMENCTGEHALYDSAQTCYDTCKDFKKLGFGGDTTGDSMFCRFSHAWLAGKGGKEPADVCPHAAPDGGSNCVD